MSERLYQMGDVVLFVSGRRTLSGEITGYTQYDHAGNWIYEIRQETREIPNPITGKIRARPLFRVFEEEIREVIGHNPSRASA